MKQAWIIYCKDDAKRNRDYIDWFIKEAMELDIQLTLMINDRFTFGVQEGNLFLAYDYEQKTMPDFVVMRTIDMLLSRHLEYMGTNVFNPSDVADMTNDKAKTHQYLAHHRIPMADTLFIGSKMPVKIPWEFPLVVKERTSRGGKDVHVANSLEELRQIREKTAGKQIIIQKMAKPGKDVRVFVIGQKVIAAILRESKQDFRANFSLGGSATVYQLSDKEKELILRITTLFDFGMVGLDFIFDKDGNFLLNEIEDVVGSRTLSLNTNINIVRLYLQHILDQLEIKR